MAAIEYLTGSHPFPDDLRDWAYGSVYSGYTFPLDMARYLEQVWAIDSEVVAIDAPQDVIASALGKGWPVLARTWEASGGYFHYCPVTVWGVDSNGQNIVVRHNPLGGFREVLTRVDFLQRYAGYLLVIQSSRGGA